MLNLSITNVCFFYQQDAGEGTSAGAAASTSAVAVQSNMSEKEEDNNNIFHDILLKYLDKKAPILGESEVIIFWNDCL